MVEAAAESLGSYVAGRKQQIADQYRAFFASQGVQTAVPLPSCTADHWLNDIVLADKAECDAFLAYTNEQSVMTGPIWRLMSELEMLLYCQHEGLVNSRWLEERVVNVPSSVPDSVAPALHD